MATASSAIPDFIEINSYEKGFSNHFKNTIKPVLEGLETTRLRYARQFKKRIFLGVLAIVLLFLFSFTLFSEWTDGSALDLPFFLSALIVLWITSPLRAYSQSAKAIYLPAVCSFFGDFKYLPTAETNIETRYRGLLFPAFDSVETEDFIEGRLGKIRMVLHETKLQQRRNKRSVTVLQALVINFEFPQAFQGRTLLKRDLGRFGNFFSKFAALPLQNLERVHLEDPLFEQYFEVYSNDQIEARVHLTTAFMERLIRLALLRSGDLKVIDPTQPLSEKAFATGKVECLFDDRFLTIVLPSSQNLFEPKSIFTSVFQADDLHVFLAQMQAIREILEILSVERRA